MCTLKFPAGIGMFVLFHGNLVHSGAPSKPETDLNSFNFAMDVRIHSYLNKKGKERNKGPIRFINHTKDASVGSSITWCDNVEDVLKNKKRQFLCKKCNKALKKLSKVYPTVGDNVVIDLSDFYERVKKKETKIILFPNYSM